MRFFSLFLSVLLLTAVMSAQKRYLVSPTNEVRPIDPGMSATGIIKEWEQRTASSKNAACPSVFYFGYTQTNYPLAGPSFGATHKDVMGQWYVVPATGSIDTVFWLTGSVNKSYDSTLFLRIHESNIGPTYGPGVRPGPFNPPCQNWGYWANTNDGDQGVAAFIEDATGDKAWVSTINGSPVPSGPPFGNELWGYGGFPVIQHVNTVNSQAMAALVPMNVTKGDRIFISLRMNYDPAAPGGHTGSDSLNTNWTLFRYSTWRANTADEDYPSRNWKFYEHDRGPSNCAGFPLADIKRGWVPRGSTSADTLDNVVWSQWYSMTVSSNVPPIISSPSKIGNTFNTGDLVVNATITDCNPANPGGAGVASAVIKWSLNGVSQSDISMGGIGADVWEGTIPGQPVGSAVTWKVYATDNDGASTVGPPDSYTIIPWGTQWFSIDTGYVCVPRDISASGTAIDTSKFFSPTYRSLTSTQVPFPKDDGTAGPFDMGNAYTLFGDAFRYAWVGVNGAISLSKSATDTIDVNSGGFWTDTWNFPYPQHHSSLETDTFSLGNMPPMTLAPFWNDLIIGDSAGQYGRILHGNGGDTCTFIVQWDSIGTFASTGVSPDVTTFRVVLNRCTGVVEYQYESVGTYGLETAALIGMQADSNAVSGAVPGYLFLNQHGYPINSRPYDGYCVRFYPKVSSYALDGWNMLAVSMTPNNANYSKAVLYPTAVSSAFAYGAGYTPATTLSKGTGYWLKFDSAGGVGNSASTFDNVVSVSVQDKWNMIGGPSAPVLVTAINATGTSVVSNYYGYGASGYFTAALIYPGKGYWVKVNGAGTLDMNSWSAAPKAVPATIGETDLASVNRITVRDAVGHVQTLYMGGEGQIRNDLGFYEMPPAPPAGAYDVRFSSQRMLESYPEMPVDGKNYEYPIAIQGAVYPVIVSWEITSPVKGSRKLVLSDVANANAILSVMEGAGSFTLKNGNVKSIAVRLSEGTNIPATYALSQNYPNPFNPVTHFRVDLPKATAVEVAVYDLLGRKIASLLSGNQAAGQYTLEWNGRDANGMVAPTGMYFLRMSSDDFNATQKIMLMK
jgi:hypothetical protein